MGQYVAHLNTYLVKHLIESKAEVLGHKCKSFEEQNKYPENILSIMSDNPDTKNLGSMLIGKRQLGLS